MKNNKIKAICEGAIMVALALVLDYLKEVIPFGHLPNGGSLLNINMLPIVFYATRYGPGLGALVGFVFGGLNYIIGLSEAIDLTTIIFDYFLAFAALGLGAGLFKGRKWGAVWGTIAGGSLQFLSSYLVGVFVWGLYMPDEFMGLTMTSPWFYSFIYNITWAVPNIILTVILFLLLYRAKPMERYLRRRDLEQD